jgi:hypothetical protein
MPSPRNERRELEVFWGYIWPALGTTFGGIMGAIIGLATSGIIAALLCALIGGLIGLETGHFFGAFVRLLFLPWLEFVRDGKYGPVAGGLAAATVLAIWAPELRVGTGVVVLLSCTTFVGGAWTVTYAQLAFTQAYRSSPRIEGANAVETCEDSQDTNPGNRRP